MFSCKRVPPILIASLLVIAIIAGALSTAAAFPNEKKVTVQVKAVIELYGFGPPDSIWAIGGEDIEFSDPYPGPDDHIYIDVEIIEMDLSGPSGISIRRNGEVASPGSSRSIEPGIDFPAESFFDVFTEIELPELPGDTLINYAPLHLTSVIDQWPPYFEHYEYPPEMPPVILYNQYGIEAGAIISWEEEIRPYYPPEVHLQIPTAYMSDVAVVNEEGFIEMSASLSGRDEAIGAEFGYRPLGDTGPFIPIDFDDTPGGPGYRTKEPLGIGDGFRVHFDPGSEPFEGQVAECRASLLVPPYGWLHDTVIVFVDPTPPIPSFFDIHRDSIVNFDIDSFFDVTYVLEDELIGPGIGEILVFPILADYHRDLTAIDQLGLGTDYDSTSCAPTAAASCLKYFADNGHGELDNPEGDESNPDQSGEDMARELQDAMGTDDAGTTPDEMVSGIEGYLEGHGQSGWTVSHEDVSDETDIGEMIREFESDGEDVLLLLQDTTATGDTIGHVVTLGSHTSTHYEQDSEPVTERSLDFMDPWGGGSTEDNEYDMDENDEGQPTTSGYDLDGAGGDAWVAGYIKVSPPEDAPEGVLGKLAPKAASREGWITVSSGMVSGHGIVDTLWWDTTGFPGGLYLMEVKTIDDQGIECRDLRLAGIPEYATGEDPGLPPFKTMLRGSYPNPFNPSTIIEYSLGKRARVTLAVYDIMGRRVRMLIDGELVEAGVHKVPWDGIGDNGRRLASGVYFCRFLAEGQVSAGKLILLR